MVCEPLMDFACAGASMMMVGQPHNGYSPAKFGTAYLNIGVTVPNFGCDAGFAIHINRTLHIFAGGNLKCTGDRAA